MRSSWRDGTTPLRDHADWRSRLDAKNRRQGTSAPTLAAVWAGPVELFGALHREPRLDGLVVDEIVVEAQSAVDEFSGRRNHDLIVRGHLPNGEGVVVCIEAKAGEDFGPTVAQRARAAAAATIAAHPAVVGAGKPNTSNASARLDGLLARFVRDRPFEQRVQDLRYQLLTALAGTISEASARDARHAVLMVHEFLTDQRADERMIEQHEKDLWNFCTTVFGVEPPGREPVPWCVEVPEAHDAPGLKLYLAHAITDLRTVTLERRVAGS